MLVNSPVPVGVGEAGRITVDVGLGAGMTVAVAVSISGGLPVSGPGVNVGECAEEGFELLVGIVVGV